MPPPKESGRLSARVMLNASGSSKTAGSRLAAMISAMIGSPGRTVASPKCSHSVLREIQTCHARPSYDRVIDKGATVRSHESALPAGAITLRPWRFRDLGLVPGPAFGDTVDGLTLMRYDARTSGKEAPPKANLCRCARVRRPR